jgi:hypothetical protein
MLKQVDLSLPLPYVVEGYVSTISMRIVRCTWKESGIEFVFDATFEPSSKMPVHPERVWSSDGTSVSIRLPQGWFFDLTAIGVSHPKLQQIATLIEDELKNEPTN